MTDSETIIAFEDGLSWDVVLLTLILFPVAFVAWGAWHVDWLAGMILGAAFPIAWASLIPRLGHSGTRIERIENEISVSRFTVFGLRTEKKSIRDSEIEGIEVVKVWRGPDYRTKLLIKTSGGDPVLVGRFDTWDRWKLQRAEQALREFLEQS